MYAQNLLENKVHPRVTYDSSSNEIEMNQRHLEREYLHPSLWRPVGERQYNQEHLSKYGNQFHPPDGDNYEARFNSAAVDIDHNQRYTLGNHIPFKGVTAYQQHYQQHPSVARSLNPQLYHLIIPELPVYPRHQIKFEGQSSYKASFKNSEIMDEIRLLNSEKINRKDFWSEQKAPFQGKSVYKSQFKPFRFEASPKGKLSCQNESKQVKFEGKSVYNDDFKNFKVQFPRRKCDVEYLPVPYVNNISSNKHIYYDSTLNKFI